MTAVTLVWRKSSRSGGAGGNGNGGDCVEVAFAARGPLLRDSKNPSRVLPTTPAAFTALLRSTRR